MFDKFCAAMLLAVGAMAEDENCCTLYEDFGYGGTSAKFCYDNIDTVAVFNLHSAYINDISSFKCG